MYLSCLHTYIVDDIAADLRHGVKEQIVALQLELSQGVLGCIAAQTHRLLQELDGLVEHMGKQKR